VSAIATSIDWRQLGGVTSVKNQGSCGSCWAFSSVAAVESSYLIKNKVTLDLSEQQLVSCSNIYGTGGCNGGWPASALKYPLNYGITTEAAYPYVAKTGTCQTSGGIYKISQVKTSAYDNCGGIRTQLQNGPVSVTLDASDWGYYKSGVFKCNPQVSINHAVTLVGYDGNKNWIIKNSWGTGWGASGYMTIKSGTTYNCGICKYGSDAAIL
jgi:cathepsin L